MPFNEGVYFISLTCYNWLALFDIADAYTDLYKQFDCLTTEGHFIVGYVIMPNHIHLLIAFRKTDKGINKRIGTMKRFLVYKLVDRLQKAERVDILHILANGVNNTDKKIGKLHAVFEPSFDCKECYSEWFILQKLEYIHNNPCKGKWQLAASPALYQHSSALFYLTGVQGVYAVTHYMDIADIDLTK